MKTANFSSKMMRVDVTYYIAECIADRILSVHSPHYIYLNLDPCSVSTVCMCGALLDEEKVKYFVEKTFVEDAVDVSC